MKFSNSLKFNAVAEWWEEYISYAALKKTIYDLEVSGDDNEHDERSALITPERPSVSANEKFLPLLDRELDKVIQFYKTQETELLGEVETLGESIARREEEGLEPDGYLDDGDSDDDEMFNGSGSMNASRNGSRPPLGKRRTNSRSQQTPRQERLSFSEDGEMDASLISLEGNGSRRPRSTSISKALTQPRLALANLFGTVKGPDTIWNAESNTAWDNRMLFKRRITTLYITATSLKSYVELNYSGFRKILKKYDKITDNHLKDRYMHESVETAYPFEQPAKARLSEAITQLVSQYARCITQGDMSTALKQLKVYQREHIVWERDTVWRQMIGKERRGESDGQVKNLVAGSSPQDAAPPLLSIPTPLGPLRITGNIISFIIAVVVFVVLLNAKLIYDEDEIFEAEANRCFALLIFATILWATEAIPLFVTSTSVPLLVIMLRVIRKPDDDDKSILVEMPAPEATKFIFSIMFSPTIMLLLGGFTLSSALSKTNIDRILITRVLSLAGTRPRTVILTFMGVACFASMWISNVAAPALCFTLIRPILSSLPPKSSFAPCLIMAIALAANIGGQTSPISSPQNLIALNKMDPALDWAHWFAVAIPVSAISIILIWLLLLVIYRPSRTADGQVLQIKPVRATRESFSPKQYFVTAVCLVTIALWCVAHSIENVFGDMGIIAIIPILAFFGTGVLKKADFDQFLWSIVFLAMGGIALGKAVDSSGLLSRMDVIIRDLVIGLPVYEVVLALTAVVLVVSTFISHTIASVLLVPIALEVGNNLPVPQPRLLIFITGLVCSTGMGMPVSGFPNQTAATQEDDMGNLYLSNIDFLKAGVPASIIAALVVATVGYLIMSLIGLD